MVLQAVISTPPPLPRLPDKTITPISFSQKGQALEEEDGDDDDAESQTEDGANDDSTNCRIDETNHHPEKTSWKNACTLQTSIKVLWKSFVFKPFNLAEKIMYN